MLDAQQHIAETWSGKTFTMFEFQSIDFVWGIQGSVMLEFIKAILCLTY